METMTEKQVDPTKIMQIGMGFWASKTLLTAINMELFTHLAEKELTGQELKTKLGLHERSLYDFLDTLVALGLLKRSGLKETSMYANAEDANLFLDKNKPSYVGGMLEMSNNRLYGFWNDLEEGLKTGLPQNETKTGEAPIFEALYRDEAKLREFLKAMGGIQMGNFMKLSSAFDFSSYSTHCDLGGAGGYLAAQIAMNNANMSCISFDLPPVTPVASENIAMMGLSDRVSIQSGDFFKDDIPQVDVITMGNILHDWGLSDKKKLLKKAYDALPDGGALIVIENVIDDERNTNVFGLLMSLNMMIETPDGFDFSFSDFNRWALEIGFSKTSIIPLTGPSSAIITIK
jgi:predicted O-methyltransferase YrrM